ncbi:MAG: glycosyltransferase family 4 protein [Oceanococcus sp.]
MELTLHAQDLPTQCQQLKQVIVQWRPDVVHLHFVGPCSPLILVVANAVGVRCVVTDHASDPDALVHWNPITLLKRLRRRWYGRHVDNYIAVSDFVLARLNNNRAGLNSIRIYNGVDLDRFSDRQWPNADIREWAAGRIVLGFVGSLNEQKGFDFLLELMAQLNAREYCLVVIGDGPLSTHIDAQQEHVLMLGNRSDVAALLPEFSLLLCPSRWDEAFGYVLAEAAASGVPALAHSVGAVSEVVADGGSGILFEDLDVDTWARTVQRLAQQPERLTGMGKMARQVAEQKFDIRIQVARTLDVYGALLA